MVVKEPAEFFGFRGICKGSLLNGPVFSLQLMKLIFCAGGTEKPLFFLKVIPKLLLPSSMKLGQGARPILFQFSGEDQAIVVVPREGLKGGVAFHSTGAEVFSMRTQARLYSGIPLIGS